jgi:signal transduction histidine kinase
MNSSFKPISGLLIIFIIAVAITGSILAYFSISTISNLKEITEKKIHEEQGELASRIGEAIQSSIEEVTEGFQHEMNPPETMIDSLVKTAQSTDFIVTPFIIKNKNSFILPNFKEPTDISSMPKYSERFMTAFRKGQEAEFSIKNLNTAKKHYLLCLNYSIKSNDSAKAMNSIGRVLINLNDYEKAFEYYNLIILKHPHLTSENGIPYSYFAVKQLLKITDPEYSVKINSIYNSFLNSMEDRLISLNYSTEELLDLVIKRLRENKNNSPEYLAHIDKQKFKIMQQVWFVIQYRDQLDQFIERNGFNGQPFNTNSFKGFNNTFENRQELLLVNTNLTNPSGFLIDGHKLFETILKKELQYEFDFEYTVDFPTQLNSAIAYDDLIYMSQLGPYFPSQMILIKLEDDGLINEIIIKRSWIYGIATLMLLVALILGLVIVLQDIAREKKLARLRTDFISNVTHELKTPLTSIYLLTEMVLLERVKKESDRGKYLSIVLRESERLKSMINNILEFSKLEKGKQAYNFVHSNLTSIIKTAIQELDYWFEKDDFDLIIELTENIYAQVDPEKITQVMGNLLSNALKYSADTKKICVRLYTTKKDIIIEVEDLGIGISEDQLPKIFEKFYRADPKESTSGTGLGLTLVKEIVEAHGGSITVTSKTGKGSKFSITLNH